MMTRKELLLSTVLVVALVSPTIAGSKANHEQDQTSDEAAMLNNQAVACVESSRYDEAIDLLKRAITLQPELASAHYNLASVYETQGRFPDAIEAFKQAVRFNPNIVGAHYHLGVAFNKTEHYAEASTTPSRLDRTFLQESAPF